jgi:hypothetical protein
VCIDELLKISIKCNHHNQRQIIPNNNCRLEQIQVDHRRHVSLKNNLVYTHFCFVSLSLQCTAPVPIFFPSQVLEFVFFIQKKKSFSFFLQLSITCVYMNISTCEQCVNGRSHFFSLQFNRLL